MLFHAACQEILKDSYNEKIISEDVPYGGLIGIGNSRLDSILNRFAVFRVHAAFHDAYGYCKSEYNKGPGYSYIIPFPFNSCFVGHVSGLIYWFCINMFNSKLFACLEG